MNILLFFLLFIGSILFFDIRFKIKKPKRKSKNKTAKDRVLELNGKRKISYSKRTTEYAEKTLASIGQPEKIKTLRTLALLLLTTGILLGLLINNIVVGIILGLGLYFIPFWCVDFYLYNFEKTVNNQLEIALNIISNSYARDKEFVSAINENLHDLSSPVRDVFLFIKNKIEAGADVEDTLESSKDILNNRMFNEWIDNVKRSMSNQMLIGSIFPTIRKLSMQKKCQLENETLMYAPIKEALSMSGLSIIILPITYFISKDWFKALTQNVFGVLIILATIVTILFTINKAIKLSKPINIYDL